MLEHTKTSRIYTKILRGVTPKAELLFIFVSSPKKIWKIRATRNEGFMDHSLRYFQLTYQNFKALAKNTSYAICLETDNYDVRGRIVDSEISKFLDELRG